MYRSHPCLTAIVFLMALLPGASITAQEAAPAAAPPFAMRVIYAPGHFGNSYEVMGEHEMRAYLAECKAWGFNRYADWFDTVDCTDPFADKYHTLMGSVLWERKKANFRSAQELGLACDMVITPNHVFAEQCCAELAAVKSDRIFGQLVCPSNPAGRAIILRNYDNLFADLAKSGVRLNALWACPYDYGGCACDACKPWILTFARLTREIYEIAAKYHPGIDMRMIGWWWSDGEHRLFAAWADQEVPGWVKSLCLHIPYGKEDVSDAPLPQGCERQAFVHIGYAEEAAPIDIYGSFGPVIAAGRIERTLAALKAHGCTGFMAYSEGVFDDVNKAMLAGLGSGAHASAGEVLSAYAKRYFDADEADTAAWAAWLRAWGVPYSVDPAASGAALAPLAAKVGDNRWRLRQWTLKLELLKANNAVMALSEWPAERLACVDEFFKAYETLEREVWGLGPARGCLGRSGFDVPWYQDWAKHQAAVYAGRYAGM